MWALRISKFHQHLYEVILMSKSYHLILDWKMYTHIYIYNIYIHIYIYIIYIYIYIYTCVCICFLKIGFIWKTSTLTSIFLNKYWWISKWIWKLPKLTQFFQQELRSSYIVFFWERTIWKCTAWWLMMLMLDLSNQDFFSNFTPSSTIMEVENYPKWKETTIGGTPFFTSMMGGRIIFAY